MGGGWHAIPLWHTASVGEGAPLLWPDLQPARDLRLPLVVRVELREADMQAELHLATWQQHLGRGVVCSQSWKENCPVVMVTGWVMGHSSPMAMPLVHFVAGISNAHDG